MSTTSHQTSADNSKEVQKLEKEKKEASEKIMFLHNNGLLDSVIHFLPLFHNNKDLIPEVSKLINNRDIGGLTKFLACLELQEITKCQNL